MGFASAGKSTAKEVLARYQAQPTVKQVCPLAPTELSYLSLTLSPFAEGPQSHGG